METTAKLRPLYIAQILHNRTDSEHDDENFMVNVEVAVNNVFFSWIFGFGGKVKIAGPEDVKNQYRDMLVTAVEEA